MKVMVIMKGEASPEYTPPPTEMFRMMGAFNMRLAEAGVLLDAKGLFPSSYARRVTLEADGPRITDGPFAETKELLVGYWTLQVESLDEAIEWMRQSPLEGSGIEIELRTVGELDNFGDTFTDDLVAQHARLLGLVRANNERAFAYVDERAAAVGVD